MPCQMTMKLAENESLFLVHPPNTHGKLIVAQRLNTNLWLSRFVSKTRPCMVLCI